MHGRGQPDAAPARATAKGRGGGGGSSSSGTVRTYGSKSSTTTGRLKHRALSAAWLLNEAAESDPLDVHRSRSAVVTLAADSSSSAGEESAEQESSSKALVVQATPSPEPAGVAEARLQAKHRARPQRSRTPSESEESCMSSTAGTPAASKAASRQAVNSVKTKSRPLVEVLIPQTSPAHARPSASYPAMKTISDAGEPKQPVRSKPHSPTLITSNGARAIKPLEDVLRKAKRARTTKYSADNAATPMSSSRVGHGGTDTFATPQHPLSKTQASSSRQAGELPMNGAYRSPSRRIDTTMQQLRALAIDSSTARRKSSTLMYVDIPPSTGATPVATSKHTLTADDDDVTPRPRRLEVDRLRKSTEKLPSSDPDSLKGVRGSSPVKQKRTPRPSLRMKSYMEEDSVSEGSDENKENVYSDTEDDHTVGHVDPASLQMSPREHRDILGQDGKEVDKHIATLLEVCGQHSFIPFSRVLHMLGAAPAQSGKKRTKSAQASASDAGLVKIGEATYSEVFRLTTQVMARDGQTLKGTSKGAARQGVEKWEERKVLKIVPIRKEALAEPERTPAKDLASGASSASSRSVRGAGSTDKAEHNESGSRRRGARARAPSAKVIAKPKQERVSTGPELSLARDVQREIEITRALGWLNDEDGAGGAHGSFVKLHGAHIVAGPYPKRLLDSWDEYDRNKEGGSENWRPDVLENNQIFAVLVLGDGGRNLEHSELDSWQQAASIYWQLVHAIALAEKAIGFEHRDLHWGNVLISPRPPDTQVLRSAAMAKTQTLFSSRVLPSKEDDEMQSTSMSPRSVLQRAESARAASVSRSVSTTAKFFSLTAERSHSHKTSPRKRTNDFERALHAQSAGVYATIIDFALSRAELEAGEGIVQERRVLAYGFDDEEIFEGKGDPQFEVYRDMRDLVEGDWQSFRPITNLMWLSFFIDKLINTHKLQRPHTDPDADYYGQEHRERCFYMYLVKVHRRLNDSVEDVLEAEFDRREARKKALRTGRPVEDYLPKKKVPSTDGGGGGSARRTRPFKSTEELLKWMRREIRDLEDSFHAGDE